jgi:hypothetical protein
MERESQWLSLQGKHRAQEDETIHAEPRDLAKNA